MKYDLDFFQWWLDRYMNFERVPDAKLFRLETTERLAGIFGHPERSYKTYHVTGSKGKGSVSRMLACVLEEAEKTTVGVYASPHVYDFRERVGAAEGFLPEQVYEETVREFTTEVDALADAESCGSWFELNAAFAFLAFRNAGCQHAVFEVGMGGRLDATNIIRPEIGLITEIELEHTEFLGDTLEKIAAEKAGIIKENTPVVVAGQKRGSVKEVFCEVAKAKNAPIYFVDELAHVDEAKYENGRLVVKISGKLFRRPLEVKLKMLAKVQAKNAMQVAVAAKILKPEMPEEVIERGLMRAILPGRFEVREKGKDFACEESVRDDCGYEKSADFASEKIILDGAHTEASIRETLATFEALEKTGQRNLLFAIAAGKDVERIVPLFKDKFDRIWVTKPGDFKKSDFAAVRKEFIKNQIYAEFGEDYKTIIRQALKAKGTLLVTGSFYLLDEVDKILNERN